MYIIASDDENRFGPKARKLLLKPKLTTHLLIIGFLLITLHGLSTYFVAEDQFFFDQGLFMNYDFTNYDYSLILWNAIINPDMRLNLLNVKYINTYANT